MSVIKEIPAKKILDRVAADSGVAIAVVDRSSIEVSVCNNNSICRNLNPEGEFSRECAAFCGKALEEAVEAGKPVNYTCHAGLECRAAAMTLDGKPVAVIVGRTFTKAENYRKATERAISGDWHVFPPSEFFENVLLSGSSGIIEKALEQVDASSVAPLAEAARPSEPVPYRPVPIPEPVEPLENEIVEVPEQPEKKTADETVRITNQAERKALGPAGRPAEPRSKPEIGAWRSFFGSLLGRDYASACESILEFIAGHYGFTSLAWLERRDSKLTAVAAIGSLTGRKLRLGIPATDERLTDAVRDEMPVELNERSSSADQASRVMYLFPVPVGSEIPSALAVLDTIDDGETRRQIARLCTSIGPRLEILRLRGEVSRRDTMSAAVRRFGEGLKHADSEDFWTRLTQVAAELMQAERGSLLVVDQASGELTIKAAIGATADLTHAPDAGRRVSRIILERGKPTIVTDVEKTGLKPSVPERGYKTSSFISAPVTLGGRRIAVINFTDKASGADFDRADLDLLREITPQIAVAIDRAVLKERAGEFEQLSVTDALTGLLNRRYIEERLIEEVKRSNRHGYPMSFIMLDVDHFKSYNDEFGHPAGDEALKIVAHVLRETLRGADVAARYGGEEFAVLLPQTIPAEAQAIAERLRANVEAEEFPCRKVTISIGVASCSAELCTNDGIVLAADKALYAAKHAGRNTVQFYDELGSD